LYRLPSSLAITTTSPRFDAIAIGMCDSIAWSTRLNRFLLFDMGIVSINHKLYNILYNNHYTFFVGVAKTDEVMSWKPSLWYFVHQDITQIPLKLEKSSTRCSIWKTSQQQTNQVLTGDDLFSTIGYCIFRLCCKTGGSLVKVAFVYCPQPPTPDPWTPSNLSNGVTFREKSSCCVYGGTCGTLSYRNLEEMMSGRGLA